MSPILVACVLVLVLSIVIIAATFRRRSRARRAQPIDRGRPAPSMRRPAVPAAVPTPAPAATPARRRTSTEPDTLQADTAPRGTSAEPDTLQADTVPSDVPRVTSTEPDTLQADLPRADPAPIGSGHGRQCPGCGRDALATGHEAWACTWCARRWSAPAGEPWPDVVLCLWHPAAIAGTQES